MTDQDYEADLSILEDMCSELEESAILLDRKQNIIWLNKVLKHKLSAMTSVNRNDALKFSLYEPTDYALARILCTEMYGKELFSENSSAKSVFSTGKMAKSLSHGRYGMIKKISIPIKNGDDVAYVLEIIEEPNQNSNSEIIPIMQYFLAQYKIPCLLVDTKHNLIFHNKIFDELFKNSPVLKDMIYQKVRNNSKNGLAELQEIIYLSHTAKRRQLKQDNRIVAYIYELHKNTRQKHGHR